MPAPILSRTVTGVVVSAGKMMKAVKVRVSKPEWNKHIKQYLPGSYSILVSDPSDSTRAGDIVTAASGWRVSKSIRHVVTSIVSPFGIPVSARAPVPSEEERVAKRKEKRFAKDVRQAARGRTVSARRVKEERRREARENWGSKKRRYEAQKDARSSVAEEPPPSMPSGEHPVGNMSERARENVGKAKRLEEREVDNLAKKEKLEG